MYSIISQNGNISYGIYQLIVETEQDIQTIPIDNLSAGSSVYVIKTGNKYILNTQKEWLYQQNNSGGGTTVKVYDGGEI